MLFKDKLSDIRSNRVSPGLFFFIIFAAFVILALILVRIWNLQHIPANVSGDEVTFLNDVVRIIYFPHKVSLFSLMGDGSQAGMNFYYMSFITKPFLSVNAILGMRLSSVLLSLIVLVVFYLYLSTKVVRFPALIATFLLGMNVIYLNFSRATWMSDGRGLGLIGGFLSFIFIERAVDKRKLVWVIMAGILAGLTLYGYLGNVIYVLTCLIYLVYMAFNRHRNWRLYFTQITLFVFTSFLVFLPQFLFNFTHFDRYTMRARSTSIASISRPYYGYNDLWDILGHQLNYTLSGFLLLTPAIAGEGVENQRYVPPLGAVDMATRVFFLLGLISLIILIKKDILLPALAFSGTIALSFFSQFPPNFARGFFALPFIYLVIAMFIEKLWFLKQLRYYGQTAMVFLFLGLGFWNARYYFQWGGSRQLSQVRQPAILYEQVPLWVTTSIKHMAADQADLVITSDEWSQLTSSTIPKTINGQFLLNKRK